MNTYMDLVAEYLLAQSWQVALLAAVVGMISYALRHRSAHVRYLLWLIVLAKCLVPPMYSVPVAVLPERTTEQWLLPFAPWDISTVPAAEPVTVSTRTPVATEEASGPHLSTPAPTAC